MIKKIYFNNAYNLEAIEHFLEEQAANGYMFVKKKGIIFYFEKCEPKQVKFITSLESITAADISYYEVDGWKYCGLNEGLHIFFTENVEAKCIRAEKEIRYKSIKYNALKRESIRWIINLMLFVVAVILVSNVVNRAELMIKHFYLLYVAIGWIIYIIADILRYVFFCVWNKRNIKKDKELFCIPGSGLWCM